MRRRLVGYPPFHELGVGHPARFAGVPLGRTRLLGRGRVDGEVLLVVDDEVDVAGGPVREVAGLDVGDHVLGVALEHVPVPSAGALADHVDLALVDELEAHAHVVGRVAGVRERPVVHERLDVERPLRRVVAQVVEDVHALDLRQRVGRAAVAAEHARHGRELRAARHGGEAPQRGALGGDGDLVAHAAAMLAESLVVALDLLRRELQERHVLLDDLLLAEVGHRGEDRRHRVLTVAVRPRPTAHAVQVGADVADELAVLGDAAEQERVDLVEPRRDDRRVLLRARVLHLREQRLGHAERLEGALQALPERGIQARVDTAALIGQHLDRVHHADAARQVGPQETEHGLVQSALRGAERGVEGAVHDLGCRPAPVDRELVALDRDRARVLEQDVLPQRRVGEEVDPVGAVGQLADPPPGLGLDVLQRLAQRDDERVAADFVDEREQPLLDPQG